MLHHVASGGLRHVENASQVHGKNRVPLFRGDVEKLVANADACVVDDHVQAAELAYNRSEGLLHLRVIGDIREERPGDCRDFLTDLLAGALVAVEDGDTRAFLQKARSGGRTDAAGTSG